MQRIRYSLFLFFIYFGFCRCCLHAIQLLRFGFDTGVSRCGAVLIKISAAQRLPTLFFCKSDSSTRLTAGPSECSDPFGFALLVLPGRNFPQALPPSFHWLSGDEGIRTPGLRRAKAALSQLSYIPEYSGTRWAFQDSNLRPRPYQRRALTN